MEMIPIIGLFLAAAGLFIPSLISSRSSRRREFKAASAPLLIKLLEERTMISKGSYPFRTLTEDELFKVFPFATKRKQKRLLAAFYRYVNAHDKIAQARHYHSDLPYDGGAFFVFSFTIDNPDEALKEIKPLIDELTTHC
ncbi:hypothetical protein CC707_14765 [Salmonella enterica subsp. enterica serovar Panama]|uniref:Uncharacterized protein n=1 Tax=Salmonella enterica subsp. enterica serovar Panama TaxID=29472 RepID=A0A636GAE5_SALET|nr:hypothetical protein [Salmonella enterica subsp. enterica serovar Panama]EDI0272373.1 hypothetical protein [Salmonella enterica subsp. enterica serovar Panama]ELR5845725.1 hypothetical protein [Salmonella enterica]